MTTAAEQAPELSQSRIDQAATIDKLGRYEFGWADSDVAGASARRGLNEDVVRDISAQEERARSGCWSAGSRALKLFDRKPMPTWGADLSGIDFDNIKYFVRSTEKQAASLGRPARRHQEHLRPAGHPGGGEAAPGRRRRRAVRVRGGLPPDPARTWSSRASSSWTPTPALREHPEIFQEYFGTVIPVGRQQVRRAEHRGVVGRLVRLRAARACTSRSRCRPTSGSTPRTWASSSAR